MLSNAFYGENSNGDWVIKIVDKKLNNEGDLNNWKLTVFGR
jgi:subtilisin-like proprotein convertase family protein